MEREIPVGGETRGQVRCEVEKRERRCMRERSAD